MFFNPCFSLLLIFLLSVSCNEKLDRFHEWLIKCLEDNPKLPNKLRLMVEDAGDMGMGTYATEDIEAESLYIYIPWKCVISYDTIGETELQRNVFNDIKEKTGRQDDFHELLLFLMYEKFVNPNSFFKPYIDTLPESFEFPLFWDESELMKISSSLTYNEILADKNRASNTYNGVKEFVLNKYPKYFPLEHFTFENYLWARAILNSRAIWMRNIPGKRNLVPLLDMINSKEGPDPTRLHSSSKNYELDAVVTLSPWDFKKGEQTFENYGSPNYQYFSYHGFVMDGNTHDCVRIEVFVPPNDAQYNQKVERLKNLGFGERHTFCVSKSELYSNQKLWSYINGLEPSKDRMEVLLKYVKYSLARYTNSIEKDKEFINSPLATWRGIQSTKLVMYEKILLQELLNTLKKDDYMNEL